MAENIELDDFGKDPLEEGADEDAADEEAADAETGLFQPINAPEQAGDRIPLLQRDLLQSSIDDYYAALVKQAGEPQLGRDPSNFELVDGKLRLKAYPNVKIINSRTGGPLALRTVYARGSGPEAIRSGNGLGFIDWKYDAARRRLPSPIRAQFKELADDAYVAATTDDLDYIDEFVDRVISGVDGVPGPFRPTPWRKQRRRYRLAYCPFARF